MARRNKRPKQVAALTHGEASRKNLPTAEHQAVLAKGDREPIPVTYERNRDLDPQLMWRGKDEQDWRSLVVPAPQLFIQDKLKPKVLIDDLVRRSKADQAADEPQVDLFADFNGLPDENARTEFYQHDANWTNRMILGDSLPPPCSRNCGASLTPGGGVASARDDSSSSMDLLRQAGESLAGRIEHVRLGPLDVHDVSAELAPATTLWVRGGFPDSLTAASDEDSMALRRNLIQTYLERDVSEFTGRRIPAQTLERLWTMLAHSQGQLLNASKLAGSLAVSGPTVTTYIDLLADLLLVRRLPPLHANVRKRLVKSPKVYVRDSGIVHALLGIASHDALIGHPVAGASWEGFVIENLLARAPAGTRASFYGTRSGAEMDLVLEFPGGRDTWAIEVKLGLTPKVARGFHSACEDIAPTSAFVVYAGAERYPLAANVEVIGLRELAAMVAAVG